MGKKRQVAYGPGDLISLAKELELMGKSWKRENLSTIKVNLDGLYKAIQALPEADRKTIEGFWGLTGGPNHSRKIVSFKDVALKEKRRVAYAALQKILTVDGLYWFDGSSKELIGKILKKVDRNKTNLSDPDAIKYLMMFVVFFINGPKMSFEHDDMKIDTTCSNESRMYEYAMLQSLWLDFACSVPDESINLQLLVDASYAFGWKDVVAMRHFVNLPVDKEDEPTEVETLRTLGEIRRFKEQLFPYGEWEVTTLLIMGNPGGELQLEGFKAELLNLRTNFDLFFYFKRGTKQIRTSEGIREVEMYRIRGLPFYHQEEVIFLYGALDSD